MALFGYFVAPILRCWVGALLRYFVAAEWLCLGAACP